MYEQYNQMENQGKTGEEVIYLAYTIPIQRGVHPHIATCSAYISATEQGLIGQAAVDKAVEIAVANGYDQNEAIVAAELGATRWDYNSLPGDHIAEASGYNALDCSATETNAAAKFKQVLKCKCEMDPIPFAAVNAMSVYFTFYGKSGDYFISNIMDYATYSGASDASAVCAGYFSAEYLLGMWYSSAIDKVAANAEFACVDEDFARTEATRLATEEHNLSSP